MDGALCGSRVTCVSVASCRCLVAARSGGPVCPKRRRRRTRAAASNGGSMLAIAMGLRRGEIGGLRWSDLDLDNRVLYVRRQMQRRRDVLYDDDPKSRRRRTVPLPPLHRALGSARDAAGSCPRQSGGEVAGVGLRLRHPERTARRAAQPLPLFHLRRRVRRPPRHPAPRRPPRPRSSRRPESRPA
jgi:integrase